MADRPAPSGTSFWVVEDEPFVRALVERLLPDLAPSMPRILVRGLPPGQEQAARRQRRQTLAFVRPQDPHIYVNRWPDVYRKARAGDERAARVLAGIFAHEHAHLTGGPDEEPAYQAGLDVMRRLGASRADMRAMERALRAVQRP